MITIALDTELLGKRKCCKLYFFCILIGLIVGVFLMINFSSGYLKGLICYLDCIVVFAIGIEVDILLGGVKVDRL